MMPELLELKDLTVNLNDSYVLKVNLELKMGEILLLGGMSGGGKTSLLRAIALLTPRTSGEIFFQGRESRDYHPWRWRRMICYLSQKPTLLPGTVEENIRLVSQLKVSRKSDYQCQDCRPLLERLGLEGKILRQDARVLSGGEASRIALARALLAKPSIILADEITAPLDEKNALKVSELLVDWAKQDKHALVVIAHQNKAWKKYVNREIPIESFRAQR